LPNDQFTLIRQPLPAPHFSLIDQSIKPRVEVIYYVLYFSP
jgi:hypothetical protein